MTKPLLKGDKRFDDKKFDPYIRLIPRATCHPETCEGISITRSFMTMLLFCLALLLLVALYLQRVLKAKKPQSRDVSNQLKPIGIDFDWNNCEPYYLRPFVGKNNFNPSMAVHNISKQREQLFLIEKSYLDATTLRKEHLKSFEQKILHCNQSERAREAVREFYSMTVEFLTQRYPQYFKISADEKTVKNLINSNVMPLSGEGEDAMHLLRVLTANVEEDILILLKDNPGEENEEYILRASLTGSPAGFDPSHNFDKPISFIHEPVPQYQSRLISPMHRFFNKLEPKDLWQRGNWSIQTSNVSFKLKDHHGRSGDEIGELSRDQLDIENACFMRCERQLLTRLPKSRAVIMLVRTYLTPVKQIKEEGLGPEMARAIESLPADLAFYKRRKLWGKAVSEYLKSS
ncbi:hypothetical protein OXX59_000611 [Metschnikowia pulcherrima]